MTPDPTEPAAAPDPAAVSDPDETGADAGADAGSEAAEETEVFQNRAARRAHSKGRRPPAPDGKGHVGAGRGSVQGPRQWGNRRSG